MRNTILKKPLGLFLGMSVMFGMLVPSINADNKVQIKEAYFSSLDPKNTQIFSKKNLVSNPKAVVVVVHGLAEHSGRYDYLTKFLNNSKLSVYRLDHRGHGKTAPPFINNNSGQIKGHIDDFHYLVDDINRLVSIAKKENPGKDVFMLGHSMGAFATQMFGLKYPNAVKGIITNGGGIPFNPYSKNVLKPETRDPKSPILNKAQTEQTISEMFPFENITGYVPLLSDLSLSAMYGRNVRMESPEFTKNIMFPNALGGAVVSDPKVEKAYVNDPLNGKEFTLGLVLQVIIANLYNTFNVEKFSVPTLIMHGGKDGLVPEFFNENWYNALRVKDKEMIVWTGLLHEVFNEPVKNQALAKVVSWINNRI